MSEPTPESGSDAGDAQSGRVVLDADDIARALTRISHEILEHNKGADDLVLLGLHTRGVPLAKRIAARISDVEGTTVATGGLDVTMYRDDLRSHPTRAPHKTDLPPAGIDGKIVVLVDDVLYSGRTIRAALDALSDLGRPAAVRLAVLVDRGHRELPIRADHVGKNLPTARSERVRLRLEETDGHDAVSIIGRPAEGRIEGGVTKHLLSIDDVSVAEIHTLFETAAEMHDVQRREVKKLPALRGRTVINLFFEDSTRTRSSFEIAGKWLSADVINLSAKGSSTSKGESLRDTVLTVTAMGVDGLIIRHPASGAPQQVAGWVEVPVINAGDGTHEHPTQALLDVYTLTRFFEDRRLGTLEGKHVAIVGDLTHSRVFRSNIKALGKLGARVTVVAPPTLMPAGVAAWSQEAGFATSYDVDDVLPEVDAVMMLRVQSERMSGGYFPSQREYSVGYGLTRDRLETLKPGTPILHPGPMNRGLEIAADAADAADSLILDQVSAGVAVRMAVLYHLLAGEETKA